VVRVAAHGARIEILAAAVTREAIGKDDEHRADAPLGEQAIEPLIDRLAPARYVQELGAAAGEAGERIQDRVALVGFVVARRQGQGRGAGGGSAEGIAAQDAARQLEPLDAAAARLGTAARGAQRARYRAIASFHPRPPQRPATASRRAS